MELQPAAPSPSQSPWLHLKAQGHPRTHTLDLHGAPSSWKITSHLVLAHRPGTFALALMPFSGPLSPKLEINKVCSL